jgi:hypothetical protein
VFQPADSNSCGVDARRQRAGQQLDNFMYRLRGNRFVAMRSAAWMALQP